MTFTIAFILQHMKMRALKLDQFSAMCCYFMPQGFVPTGMFGATVANTYVSTYNTIIYCLNMKHGGDC